MEYYINMFTFAVLFSTKVIQIKSLVFKSHSVDKISIINKYCRRTYDDR